MARCVDCVNKYTYDNISFVAQPCDGCNNFNFFKPCVERNFWLGTDTENDERRTSWNYLRCRVKVLNKNEFRFDLEAIGYNEHDMSTKGAYKNGQLLFTRLPGQVSYINNDATTKFIQLGPHDIYMNYNIGRFMEIVSKEVCKNETPKSHDICQLVMDTGPCEWDKNRKLIISEVVYEK